MAVRVNTIKMTLLFLLEGNLIAMQRPVSLQGFLFILAACAQIKTVRCRGAIHLSIQPHDAPISTPCTLESIQFSSLPAVGKCSSRVITGLVACTLIGN